MKKRILSIVLTLCVVLMLFPTVVFAEGGVKYLDWDTTNKRLVETEYTGTYTSVTDSVTTWGASGETTWYVVQGNVTIGTSETPQPVTVSGDVHLILSDGCNLTINGDINGGSLTIYGQAGGTGTIDVSGTIIGGNGEWRIGGGGGSITISGGVVEASSITGGTGGTGYVVEGESNTIYNGGCGGSITISGGVVEARSITGGTGGSSMSGTSGTGGSVTITGGVVEAESITGGTGGDDGSFGGGGGSITISGGVVEAGSITGGTGGGSFGGGGGGGTITISGGIVEAESINGGIGGNGPSVGVTGDKSIIGGVVFQGGIGQVYETSVTLSESFTISAGKILNIESDKTLIIPDGVTLTNNGKIYVDGTFTGTADNLYYPLTLVDASASGDTSEHKGKTYGKAGSAVALSATPQEGKIIIWNSSLNIDISDNSFTMPKEALIVTAQWVDCPHTGDTETRNAKAATCTEEGYTGDIYCKVCKKEISKGTATNMLAHKLDNIPAKDATVTETGNKEYWQCKDCKKYFSDEEGNTQIIDIEAWKTGEGRIDKLPPEIIEGKGQNITAGEKKELTFRSNAAIGDFLEVQLDGKTLDAKYYTVKEGSTVVTLKADYVATLSAGEHTIGIVSTSGTAATTFTVAKSQKPTGSNPNNPAGSNPNNPAGSNSNTGSVNHVSKTGDNSHLALWIALMLISGILLSVMGINSKKKKHNR